MRKTQGRLAGLFVVSIFVAMSIAGAQTAARSIDQPFIHPKWTGVWQGTLDGVPAVTLTLADDAGEPNGTIVFHAIARDKDHAYSFSTEPHTLIHPQIEGNTLAFEVKRGNGSTEILRMAVELAVDGNVHFRCSNCNPETHAELARVNW